MQSLFCFLVVNAIILLGRHCNSQLFDNESKIQLNFQGFEAVTPKNYYNVTYPLDSKDVSEGPCLIDPPTAFPNIFWIWPRTYYITVGSEYAFRRYAEIFLGRSAKSEEELESMCLRLELVGLTFKTVGYGEYLRQTFVIPWWRILTLFDFTTVKALTDGASSEKVQTSFVHDYTDILVLTDNASFGMYARCVNGVKDFKVLTTSPDVSEEIFNQIHFNLI